MAPSASIVASATVAPTVTDSEGRHISVRRLTALDKLRLFKAAGPVLAHNQHWLGMAALAYSVVAIDDIPIPSPVNEQQIEAVVGRLGDSGINAVANALNFEPEPVPADMIATVGN